MADDARETGSALLPKWDGNGLVTAVASDAATGELLMVAHMNADALKRTLATGKAHFWSRSRGRLWKKGETAARRLRRSIEAGALVHDDAAMRPLDAAGDARE